MARFNRAYLRTEYLMMMLLLLLMLMMISSICLD